MSIEILVQIVSGLLSLGSAALLGEFFPRLLRRILKKEETPQESYSERLARLTESLTKASTEVDGVLKELAQIARDREQAVQKLEGELGELESKEKQLQQRIQELEKVPLPVAEHFAKLIAAGEKRSAWRDYFLFGAGVVVSTIIAIILKLLGWG